MTDEEGFRVADLVLAIIERGCRVTKGDIEAAWLRKTTDAVRALLPDKD
jgi:meiotically up-regulated gene 157 (Mug157) protein